MKLDIEGCDLNYSITNNGFVDEKIECELRVNFLASPEALVTLLEFSNDLLKKRQKAYEELGDDREAYFFTDWWRINLEFLKLERNE